MKASPLRSATDSGPKTKGRVWAIGAIGCTITACSLLAHASGCAPQSHDGLTGHSSNALTLGANVNVTPGVFQMHETSTVSITSPTTGLPIWVVGFNWCADPVLCNIYRTAGSAYSGDATGGTWTVNPQMPSGLAFGDPGTSSDNRPFGGWVGDPGLAPVTDPQISANNTRVLYTNVGISNSHNATQGGTDIVVAISTNGGRSWNNANYVNVPLGLGGLNPSNPTQGTDQPAITSDIDFPYSTFVAWTVDGKAYINSIRYDTNLAFTRGTPQVVPVPPPGLFPNHPKLAIGKVIDCSGGSDEIVYVAWADAGGSRGCDGSSGRNPITVNWYAAAYNASLSTPTSPVWYGPWFLNVDGSYANCIGNPNNITPANSLYDGDSSNPSLAADGRNLITTLSHSTQFGQRIISMPWTLSCVSGSMSLTPNAPTWFQSPDPCYIPGSNCIGPDGGTTGNGPDGGPVLNDDWGAQVAILRIPPSTREVLVTYLSTRNDLNNNLVNVWYGTANNVFANPVLAVHPVGVGGQGTQVPWDHTLAYWWDYQSIGVDTTSQAFLAVWGGDARTGSNTSGIWSARLRQ